MTHDADELIRQLARLFQSELARLHEKSDWPDYKQHALTLVVQYSRDKSTFQVKFDPSFYDQSGTVTSTELGPLMDEVYRRFSFDDRQQAKVEQSLAEAITFLERGEEDV